METFEIHITGEKEILNEFKQLNIKTIVVELLTPSLDLIRTEYMSSFIVQHESLSECQNFVKELLNKLKTRVIRVKIESPFYEHYNDISLYLETHFTPFNTNYPVSRNVASNKLIATDRVYNKKEYPHFIKKWSDNELEMCLIDSFVNEDLDWFEKYSQNSLAESN